MHVVCVSMTFPTSPTDVTAQNHFVKNIHFQAKQWVKGQMTTKLIFFVNLCFLCFILLTTIVVSYFSWKIIQNVIQLYCLAALNTHPEKTVNLLTRLAWQVTVNSPAKPTRTHVWHVCRLTYCLDNVLTHLNSQGLKLQKK